MRYFLIPLKYRSVLLEENLLHLVEESKKKSGYYIKEEYYLLLQNKNLLHD